MEATKRTSLMIRLTSLKVKLQQAPCAELRAEYATALAELRQYEDQWIELQNHRIDALQQKLPQMAEPHRTSLQQEIESIQETIMNHQKTLLQYANH